MSKPNCMTCKHRTHDAERLMVCGLVYGWIACQHCKRIQIGVEYSNANGGMMCKTCNRGQPHLITNDWREGYLGPIADHITPIPCCPGWDAEEVVVAKIERQRGLFDE